MADADMLDAPVSSIAGMSVLVLGATGGLGGAVAVEMARRGARLTLVGRRVDALWALPVEGSRHVLDLRSPEACAAAVAAAVAAHGRLDVVINAVGVVAFGPVDELSIDTMEELFLTNTFIPIMIARAALPVLQPGGVLMNVSGIVAESNLAGMAAYGASKAAVRSFDQALGREARRRSIRVIDARPPHTETGLADRAIQGTAPRFPTGLSPADVASVLCTAVERGATDLPSTAFAP